MTSRSMIVLSMIVLSALTLGAGCGASAEATSRDTARADAMWTAAQLGKLEPTLRTRMRQGEDERVAVRVYFLELPTDAELSSLLLNRVGEQVIGQVEPEDLQRIAARRDVEHIEPLRDVGYVEPGDDGA